jgi:hypothetical protein
LSVNISFTTLLAGEDISMSKGNTTIGYNYNVFVPNPKVYSFIVNVYYDNIRKCYM